jgi:hypothetical protein
MAIEDEAEPIEFDENFLSELEFMMFEDEKTEADERQTLGYASHESLMSQMEGLFHKIILDVNRIEENHPEYTNTVDIDNENNNNLGFNRG